MTDPSTPQITIKCCYYKPSGKAYTSGEEKFAISLFEGCIYPSEHGRRLLDLGLLPGLQGGTWSGPFAVLVNDTYWELVYPPETILLVLDEAEIGLVRDLMARASDGLVPPFHRDYLQENSAELFSGEFGRWPSHSPEDLAQGPWWFTHLQAKLRALGILE